MVTDLIVGRYELLEELGDNKKAIDRLTGREVVLRSRAPGAAPSDELLEKLVLLRHPNLAALLHHFPIDNESFLVTEFVEGPTLESLLSESPGPDAAKAHTWMTAMAAGTQAAHEAGLLVGELSPSKVVVSSNDTVKLLDPGFSGLTADPSTVLNELATLGAIYRRMLGDAANANPALGKIEAAQSCADILTALKEIQVADLEGGVKPDRKPIPKRTKRFPFKKWDRRHVIAVIATLIGIIIGYRLATHGQSSDGFITRWIESLR